MTRLTQFPAALFIFLSLFTACSSSSRKDAKLYQAGEKAAVGKLTYSVVDAQRATVLTEDGGNQRTPQNRFYIVQVAISNSANDNASIPGMSLVNDSGKSYAELADGAGVQGWLGVVRSVAPAETTQGTVVFDAPADHYRLRLTEDGDDDVSIDLPVTFVHDVGVSTQPDIAK